MYWFHRHSAGAHTGKSHSNTHNNANAGDHSDRDSQSYACDIHQHDEPYTYQYIDTDTYSNGVGHIYIVPACYIDSVANADAVINSFSDSVDDTQFHIDTLVHCRCSYAYTVHHFLPVSDLNISLT